jgi:hypothetical protein
MTTCKATVSGGWLAFSFILSSFFFLFVLNLGREGANSLGVKRGQSLKSDVTGAGRYGIQVSEVGQQSSSGELVDLDSDGTRASERLQLPNLLGVVLDGSVGRELAHTSRIQDRHAPPLLGVLVGLIDLTLSLQVTLKVGANEVVVMAIGNAVDDVNQLVEVAELTRTEHFNNQVEARINLSGLLAIVPYLFVSRVRA